MVSTLNGLVEVAAAILVAGLLSGVMVKHFLLIMQKAVTRWGPTLLSLVMSLGPRTWLSPIPFPR